MTKTLTLAAAIAAAVSGTASAAPRYGDVTAIYHTDTRQFCVEAGWNDPTDPLDTSRRACRTKAQWLAHGIRFEEPTLVLAAK